MWHPVELSSLHALQVPISNVRYRRLTIAACINHLPFKLLHKQAFAHRCEVVRGKR